MVGVVVGGGWWSKTSVVKIKFQFSGDKIEAWFVLEEDICLQITLQSYIIIKHTIKQSQK